MRTGDLAKGTQTAVFSLIMTSIRLCSTEKKFHRAKGVSAFNIIHDEGHGTYLVVMLPW